MKEPFNLGVYPVHLSPRDERAVSFGYRPTENALLGVTRVENPILNYLIYRAAITEQLGKLGLVAGVGYANDGRGLMAEFGADYPITDSLSASYRHFSSPNYGDDGSDFLGLTWSFD